MPNYNVVRQFNTSPVIGEMNRKIIPTIPGFYKNANVRNTVFNFSKAEAI
jgi:hypothetical protein